MLEALRHVVAKETRLGFHICYSAVHFSSVLADHTRCENSSQRRSQEEDVVETEDAKRWHVIGIVSFSGTIGLGEEALRSCTAGESKDCISAGFIAPDDTEKGIPTPSLGFRFRLIGNAIKHSIDISSEVDKPGGVEDHSHISTWD